MHWFAAPRPCFTAAGPCLAVFCKKRDPLTPVRSKHASTSPNYVHLSSKCSLILLWPGPPFKRPSLVSPHFARNAIRWRLRVQTHCRPSSCRVFLKLFLMTIVWFSRKCNILLRPGPTFERPSLVSPHFTTNAIRLRLRGPNTLPSTSLWRLFEAFFCKV